MNGKSDWGCIQVGFYDKIVYVTLCAEKSPMTVMVKRRNLIFLNDVSKVAAYIYVPYCHIHQFQAFCYNLKTTMARPSIRLFSLAFTPRPLGTPRVARLSLRPRTTGAHRPFGSAPSGVNSTASKYTPKSSSSSISILLRPTSLILILVPILTGFLGVWQLKRLRWKLDLIEEVDRNLHKEPMLLPGNIKWVFFFSLRPEILAGC